MTTASLLQMEDNSSIIMRACNLRIGDTFIKQGQNYRIIRISNNVFYCRTDGAVVSVETVGINSKEFVEVVIN